MTNRQGMCWVSIAVVLFLLQEVSFFDHRWVEDESWYSIPAYSMAYDGHLRNPTFAENDFEAQADMRPPAMALTLSGVFRVFGLGIIQARAPSLLAGFVLIPCVYFLAATLAGPYAGVIAAFIVSSDNFIFAAARTTRPEIYVATLGTLALLFWSWSQRSVGIQWAALSGLAAGLAINYHVQGIAIAFSVGFLFLRDSHYRPWKARKLLTFCLVVILTLIPFGIWVTSDSMHLAAFKAMYSRGFYMTPIEKIIGEITRYSDFIGLGNQRIHLPVRVPLRLHIAGAIVVGLVILYRRNRGLLTVVLIAILPSLIWWAYLVNKSSRYFAVIGSMLGILLGCASAMTSRTRVSRRISLSILVLLIATQLFGNGILLEQSRMADYTSLGARLQKMIPEGSSTYGAITFWMALPNRKFCSYNRMPLQYAIDHIHPAYIIFNDRVMVSGEGNGEDTWAVLRKECQEFVDKRGFLIAAIPSPFYGNLKLFEIRY